jgi:Zn-finger nucleic acid-binding protein
MSIHCPSCAETMQAPDFDGSLGGRISLDLCFACQAIWFDHNESTRLAPGAVIELFKLIHAHRDEPRRPLSASLACPRCTTRLAFTHDFARSNAITYYRCELCLGRLTEFLQFLREKQFVRDLTQTELSGLRVQIEQVRCSGCGAAINLKNDSACPYCRAPISMLDADAVNKALQSLANAERTRTTPVDPQHYADAFADIMRAERERQANESPGAWMAADLIGAGIGALLSIVAR